jgi:cation-transporting P-type ATPase E
MLARDHDPRGLSGDGTDGRLPAGMQAVGLVAVSDELRPAAGQTLAAFKAAGVRPKIISGDNPETVAALARQAGMETDRPPVSGADLAGLDQDGLADLAEKATVFGRIGPQDKARLVDALRSRGHYVAMLGDGVNDVLALKAANLAVAMHGGSQAARGVADIVLLNDSFASLVPAVGEGQRIRNGMQSILKLYLTRIGMVASVIVASLVIGIFPIDVRNGSAVTLFSVGLPTLALTVWARPGPVRGTGLGHDLFSFVVPAVFLSTAIGVLLFYGVLFAEAGFPDLQAGQTLDQLQREIAAVTSLGQTSLTAFLVFCGVSLFALVVPFAQDRRPLLMAGGLGLLFLVVILTPLRELFALQAVGPTELIAVVAALAAWLILLTATWRWRLVDRYLALGG